MMSHLAEALSAVVHQLMSFVYQTTAAKMFEKNELNSFAFVASCCCIRIQLLRRFRGVGGADGFEQNARLGNDVPSWVTVLVISP